MRHRCRPGSVFLACGLLLLCGCPGKKPDAPAPPPAPAETKVELTAQDTETLERLRTVALAHLENQEFGPCEAALQEIRTKLPDDLFVWQNLAICQQLATENIDAGRDAAGFAKAMQAAEKAVNDLTEHASKSGIPLLLKARLALKSQQKPAAITALQTAIERDADFLPGWYELYQIRRESAEQDDFRDPQKRQPIFEAGRQVARLAPDNWFLWKDWIVDLARAEDPDLKPLLERMRIALQPFASTYQRDVRVNPVTLIDNALKAWDDGQKARAVPVAMTLRNILLLESAQDKARLSPHALDFVVTEFSTTLPPAPPVSGNDKPLDLKFTAETIALDGIDAAQTRAVRSLDVDIDGQPDLVVLLPRRLQVFTKKDAAWTPLAGVDLPAEASAFLAADIDDDADAPTAAATDRPKTVIPADPDFIVWGPGGLWVFENQPQGDGTRSLVLRDNDVPWAGITNVAAVALLDLDGDGDLDLFAGAPTPRCFIYRGNFLYGEITERSQLPPPEFHATAVVAVDWDRDVDVDLILASADHGVAFLENIRHGRFRYHEMEAAWQPLAGATSLKIAELNGDGAWDLVATTPQGTVVAVTQRSLTGGGGPHSPQFTRVTESAEDWLQLADFDNDGAIDIATSDGTSPLRRNDGHAVFAPSTNLTTMKARAACADDVDHDGDVDLWLLGDSISLIRNDNGNQNHWLELRPRGAQEKGSGQSNSNRVNHQALGSLIELRTGDRYQAGIVDDQSIRFGLGKATQPDAIRIVWTNGTPRAIPHPKIDQVLFEEFLPGGSCPYLYTWDGERFVFHTDLLWNAPLGLKFAEDVVAPWREWEYLKIDGDRMKPRSGEYVLQFTEELWEAAYFDEIKLMAIDHPAEVQVFTNEKVGPPDMAEPKLHTVTSPRLPLAAHDPQGHDILDVVQARDNRYTRTMEPNIASGLVPEHYLELNFGNLSGAKQVTLFLTGWMFPTDTSLNVQFSQDPTMPRPRPPSLWAPDANGTWREVRPFLGFPGGKTKTIAIDVTDALTLNDARLRIVTNMEFYWDHTFISVDEAPVTVREQPLRLKQADLHFRGCSQAVYRPFNAPEFYDYDTVQPVPTWPPFSGCFTRYGDVTPLLRERDDQLAIFGAGDEMTVTFDLPEKPLPEGWVRDFVLYNVGWDKDAVLNTVSGSSVEPLPYREMQIYGDGAERPRDVEYENYLRTYQTREQSPAAFWDQLRHGKRRLLPSSRRETSEESPRLQTTGG